MLAINPPSTTPRTLIPNLLPCAIQHNGPVPISGRYWDPHQVANTSSKNQPSKGPDASDSATEITKENDSQPDDASSTMTVYFRGRKLHGRALACPSTHQGLIVEKTDNLLPQVIKAPTAHMPVYIPANAEDDEDEDPFRRSAIQTAQATEDDLQQEVKQLNVQAHFDQIMVWGHEAEPGADDAFVRGVEEWMVFADAMHQY